MSSSNKKRVNIEIIRIIFKIRRRRYDKIYFKLNLLWYFSEKNIFVYIYKFEVFIRLSYQAENDSKKEINNKHFIFKTILWTTRNHRNPLNKRKQKPN